MEGEHKTEVLAWFFHDTNEIDCFVVPLEHQERVCQQCVLFRQYDEDVGHEIPSGTDILYNVEREEINFVGGIDKMWIEEFTSYVIRSVSGNPFTKAFVVDASNDDFVRLCELGFCDMVRIINTSTILLSFSSDPASHIRLHHPSIVTQKPSVTTDRTSRMFAEAREEVYYLKYTKKGEESSQDYLYGPCHSKFAYLYLHTQIQELPLDCVYLIFSYVAS